MSQIRETLSKSYLGVCALITGELAFWGGQLIGSEPLNLIGGLLVIAAMILIVVSTTLREGSRYVLRGLAWGGVILVIALALGALTKLASGGELPRPAFILIFCLATAASSWLFFRGSIRRALREIRAGMRERRSG